MIILLPPTIGSGRATPTPHAPSAHNLASKCGPGVFLPSSPPIEQDGYGLQSKLDLWWIRSLDAGRDWFLARVPRAVPIGTETKTIIEIELLALLPTLLLSRLKITSSPFPDLWPHVIGNQTCENHSIHIDGYGVVMQSLRLKSAHKRLVFVDLILSAP